MANPWDNDPIAQPSSSPFGSRPVITEHPAPDKPNPGVGYIMGPDGTAHPIPGGSADPNKDLPTVGLSPASGAEYLKTLDPGTGAMVKALAEGRKAFPTGAGLRAPYWQNMLQHLSNYDPGFDEVNYTSRAATRRDFTSGKAANNIRALNTAIGHLGHLEEQIGGTASHSLTPVNAIENSVMRLTGNPGPTNFDATVSALAGELTAVYRGSGGAEADIQRYVQQLNPNASHDQKVGTIRNIVGLLKSRLDALNDQYRQGMGTTAQQLQLLDPQAQLIVQHLGGFDGSGNPQDGGAPPPGPGGGGAPPNMPNDPVAPASGGTKEVVHQNLTPVRREYMARLEQGQSPQELISFLRQAGVTDPKLLKTAVDQAMFRKKNPNVPVNQYDTSAIDHITQQMSAGNRALNAVGQTPLGAGAISAGNAMLAGYGPEVVGALGGNAEQARLNQQYSAQDNPNASLVGGVVGGTAAALGGEAALGRLGMSAGFGRSLLADSAYGAAAGSGASPENRALGATEGAAFGALGSVGGQALAKGGGSLLRGVKNADVSALADAGVGPMTTGQIVSQSGTAGRLVKGVEDRLQSFSGVGDLIRARRIEGVKSFNTAAFNKALAPIGGSVEGATGEQAVASASQQVSNAFSSALKGKQAAPDKEFISAARGPIERLANNKRVGPEIVQSIEDATQGLFDENTGAISGENMQSFLQGLRQIREGYRKDPLYSTLIKPSVQGIENAVEGMFRRQAPEVMPQFNRAKAAYRRLSTLADAVNRASETDGVFAPSQLGGAAKANAKKFDGSIASASGNRPFFGLQRPAQNVLPSKVPDSGTAGRLALVAGSGSIPAVGAGVGYLGGDTKTGAETGLGLTGLLALAYTRAGQARIAKILLSRSPRAQALAAQITQRAPALGAAGTALTQTPGQ